MVLLGGAFAGGACRHGAAGVALLPEALDVVRAAKIPIILGFARIVFVFIIFAS